MQEVYLLGSSLEHTCEGVRSKGMAEKTNFQTVEAETSADPKGSSEARIPSDLS